MNRLIDQYLNNKPLQVNQEDIIEFFIEYSKYCGNGEATAQDVQLLLQINPFIINNIETMLPNIVSKMGYEIMTVYDKNGKLITRIFTLNA